MKSNSFLLWTIVIALVSIPVVAEEGKWVNMFDGKSLDNWTQKNGTATYRIVGKRIVGKTAKGSPNSFLCSNKEYGDFEMQFQVRCADELNSGVQIRSKTKEPKTAAEKEANVGRVYGPQVEIEASGENGAQAGYVYGEATGRGWLTPPERLVAHKHFKDGKWNTYRIIAKGPRIQTFINGQKIEDITDEEIYKTHPKGFIGLQVHGVGNSGPYEVAWRRIRIKEL